MKWYLIYFFNLYHSLGEFSRWQINDIFLIFPRKQDLTFLTNCLQWRHFVGNVKTCFQGKNKKNLSICRLLKILLRVHTVHQYTLKNVLCLNYWVVLWRRGGGVGGGNCCTSEHPLVWWAPTHSGGSIGSFKIDGLPGMFMAELLVH